MKLLGYALFGNGIAIQTAVLIEDGWQPIATAIAGVLMIIGATMIEGKDK